MKLEHPRFVLPQCGKSQKPPRPIHCWTQGLSVNWGLWWANAACSENKGPLCATVQHKGQRLPVCFGLEVLKWEMVKNIEFFFLLVPYKKTNCSKAGIFFLHPPWIKIRLDCWRSLKELPLFTVFFFFLRFMVLRLRSSSNWLGLWIVHSFPRKWDHYQFLDQYTQWPLAFCNKLIIG